MRRCEIGEKERILRTFIFWNIKPTFVKCFQFMLEMDGKSIIMVKNKI